LVTGENQSSQHFIRAAKIVVLKNLKSQIKFPMAIAAAPQQLNTQYARA